MSSDSDISLYVYFSGIGLLTGLIGYPCYYGVFLCLNSIIGTVGKLLSSPSLILFLGMGIFVTFLIIGLIILYSIPLFIMIIAASGYRKLGKTGEVDLEALTLIPLTLTLFISSTAMVALIWLVDGVPDQSTSMLTIYAISSLINSLVIQAIAKE